jgi:serine/threonine protein kinase
MESMGQLVDGRYAMTYRIHVGGTATIYLARDQFLQRPVVLKMLHPSLATDPAHVERFRRAACTAAALSHPNLIAVYNLGTYAGTYYIVMEHVTGPSLSQALQIGGRVSETRALQIASQVAAALAAAHERGIVHRDIRSHTILLAAGGQVKITDFGCAAPRNVCGPDAVQSDLANLGLVMHEMLTGIPAMQAGALSPYADAIVRRALAPDAAQRFPTANAMHAAIEDALSQIASATQAMPVRAPVYAMENQPRMGLIGLFRPRSTRLAS